jgi:hypothetical protein
MLRVSWSRYPPWVRQAGLAKWCSDLSQRSSIHRRTVRRIDRGLPSQTLFSIGSDYALPAMAGKARTPQRGRRLQVCRADISLRDMPDGIDNHSWAADGKQHAV